MVIVTHGLGGYFSNVNEPQNRLAPWLEQIAGPHFRVSASGHLR